jgi:hypothetical protein
MIDTTIEACDLDGRLLDHLGPALHIAMRVSDVPGQSASQVLDAFPQGARFYKSRRKDAALVRTQDAPHGPQPSGSCKTARGRARPDRSSKALASIACSMRGNANTWIWLISCRALGAPGMIGKPLGDRKCRLHVLVRVSQREHSARRQD